MNDLCTFPDFEEIPHIADAALIVFGLSLPELFSHAALGMYHILGLSEEKLRGTKDIIVLQAPDLETMLVSFLTELLYLTECGYKTEILKIEINVKNLEARICKIPIIGFSNVIKAVTFNEMKIIKKDEIYQTRIVFDL